MEVREGFEGEGTPVEPVKVLEVVLEKFRYSKQFKVSREILKSMTVEQKPSLDYMLREYVYELTCHVLAEKTFDRTVDVHFNNPTTWWDMFKIRFFPKRLLDRFPAMYTLSTKIVNFKEYATYPQLTKVLEPDETGIAILRSVVTQTPY